MADKHEIKKKIVLLGDGAVGKTCLIRRYVYDVFEDDYIVTLGAKATTKDMDLSVSIDDKPIHLKMLIYDILGQKTHIELTEMYYRGAEGALLVCDRTNKESLDNIPLWYESLKRVVGEVPMVLIANKNDLKNQFAFDESEIKQVADIMKGSFYLTSAKTGEGVEAAFLELGNRIGNNYVESKDGK